MTHGELVELNGELCWFCHKRKAEFACDFPVGYGREFDVEGPGVIKDTTSTCNRKMCSICATEVGLGTHFCPKHMKEMEEIIRERKMRGNERA